MRIIVELCYSDDGVEGEVIFDDRIEPERFSSWLDLLRVLERPLRSEEPVE